MNIRVRKDGERLICAACSAQDWASQKMADFALEVANMPLIVLSLCDRHMDDLSHAINARGTKIVVWRDSDPPPPRFLH